MKHLESDLVANHMDRHRIADNNHRHVEQEKHI